MIASLPMYWQAGTADAWRRFWARLQRQALLRGVVLPELTAPRDIQQPWPQPWSDHWLRPDLALSMACSLPLRTVLRDKVAYVGTLDFGCSDKRPGFYTSTRIQATGPARDALALNGYDSQSGWAAVSDQDRARARIVTGSHAAALAAVADGRASSAYIDTVTWRLLQRFDANAARVRVTGVTAPSPGLPLIAALGADLAGLRAALDACVNALPADLRGDLCGLRSFVVHDIETYLGLPLPPEPAARSTLDCTLSRPADLSPLHDQSIPRASPQSGGTMHIGILITGHIPEEMQAEHGDYGRIFSSYLSGRGLTFTSYFVVDGQFPQTLDEADGWLITGSKHGVYEDHDWIAPLEKLIRGIHARRAPLVGVCFGHQIIAQALGGRVEKFSGGWAIGRTTYDGDPGPLTLNAWHQDQVIDLPDDARTLAGNDFCRHAVLAYGEHIWTVQPHPEFNEAYFRDLARARADVVPRDRLEPALETAGETNDNDRIATLIAAHFLTQTVQA